MKKQNLRLLGVILVVALPFSSCIKHPPCDCNDENDGATSVKVYATGLINPRGLKFGPDGYLYVAEAGKGGTTSTVGQCEQVPAPVGPNLGSKTGGRISKISGGGQRSTVSDQFPSSINALGDILGVADVEFKGNTLYALVAGGGCSHGVASIPNGIGKISGGSLSGVADISEFLKSHPVANPEEDDFEPDGTPYSLIRVGDDFYVVEPNHGELLKIKDGHVSRVVDISKSQGHIVPTVVAYHDGNFYVGNLNTFPIVDGSSKILKITPDGHVSDAEKGFTTILGILFDKKGRLYVLENTTGNPFPTPNTGRIVRVNKNGSRTVITKELSLPTGMTFGPDGNLYVSNIGFSPAGITSGQVVKVTLKHCDCDDHDGDHEEDRTVAN